VPRNEAESMTPRKTIRELLSVIRGRRVVIAWMHSLLVFVTLAGVIGLVLPTIEALFRLSSGERWTLLVVGACVTALFLYLFSRSRWRSTGDLASIAADAEATFPEFRERLAAAREFEEDRFRGSPEIARAVVDEAAEILESADARPLADSGVLRRPVMIAAGVLMVMISAHTVFPSSLGPAVRRLMAPGREFMPDPGLSFTVHPGDTRVARGDTLRVHVQLSGRLPRTVNVRSRDQGVVAWRGDDITVMPVAGRGDSAVAVWEWPQLRADAEYEVVATVPNAPPVRSKVYHVEVVERPRVANLVVRLNPPAYSGLKTDTLADNSGTFSSLSGTIAHIDLTLNKPVMRGTIRFSTGDSITLSVSDRFAVASWKVMRSLSYHVELIDEYGYRNPDPITYGVTAIRDEKPTVRIVHPGRESDIDRTMLVPLRIEAMDDYGFSRMALSYRLPSGKTGTKTLPLVRIGRGQAVSNSIWDVGDLDMLPEDRLVFRAVVWDNDRITGPKKSMSEEHVLRFPSAVEIFEDAEKEQEKQVASLRDIARKSVDMQKRLDALQRELLRHRDLSWESRKEVARIVDQQKKMNREITRTAEKLKKVIETLKKHDVFSPETLTKISEIQKLMSETITPELKKALDDLRKNAAKMTDYRRVNQAMKNIMKHRKEFERRLDRVLNLLKEARIAQKLDAATRRMKELARMQEDAARQMKTAEPRSVESRERTLAKQVDEARKKLAEMAREMKDIPLSPADSLSDLAKSLTEKRISRQLRELSAKLSRGEKSPGMQKQANQVARDLRDAAQKMQRIAESRRQQSREDMADRLTRAATNLLRLSFMQERLMDRTRGQRQRDSLTVYGSYQIDLRQGAARVSKRITEAARKSVLISPLAIVAVNEAIKGMDKATTALGNGQSRPAKSAQGGAMGQLNVAVAELWKSRKKVEKSRYGTGLEKLMDQLSDISKRQESLNKGTEQMSGEGGTPSPEALAQMAAEQQALAQMMNQLGQQLAQYRQIMGRMDNLEGEMKRAAEDIARGVFGERLKDRQRRIYKRLLDAQRSLRKGKKSEKRISETGRDLFARDPGSLPENLGERRAFLREALLEALRAGYPPEYRRWIRSYYERLLSPPQDEPRPSGPEQ
jgi:hypothetical protein